MSKLEVLGRSKRIFDNEEYTGPRATCSPGKKKSASVWQEGKLTVQLFHSDDNEDRGGVVIRITGVNGSEEFIPTAKIIDDGVEIHMAGDHEGRALLNLLVEVINGDRQILRGASALRTSKDEIK